MNVFEEFHAPRHPEAALGDLQVRERIKAAEIIVDHAGGIQHGGITFDSHRFHPKRLCRLNLPAGAASDVKDGGNRQTIPRPLQRAVVGVGEVAMPAEVRGCFHLR